LLNAVSIYQVIIFGYGSALVSPYVIEKKPGGFYMKKQVRVYNTSADYVYADLRSKIISKQIKPGTRLPEVKLASNLKVSRTPVREALRRLASEGLVVLVPNSGARVIKPTVEEIKDIFAVRDLLECECVFRAARNGLEKRTVSKIEQIISTGRRAFARKDAEAILDSDHAFHKALAAACGSPALSDLVDNILLRSCVFVLVATPVTDSDQWLEEHQQLLSAVAARDDTAAVSLVKKHLRLAISMLTIPE